MQINIEIPDEIGERIAAKWHNLPWRTLEILAAQAYRAELITAGEVRQMLNLPSRLAVDAFLKQQGVDLNYTEADLEQDIQAIHKVLSKNDRCL